MAEIYNDPNIPDRHLILEDGTYVVQIDVSEETEIPEGAIVVNPRKHETDEWDFNNNRWKVSTKKRREHDEAIQRAEQAFLNRTPVEKLADATGLSIDELREAIASLS